MARLELLNSDDSKTETHIKNSSITHQEVFPVNVRKNEEEMPNSQKYDCKVSKMMPVKSIQLIPHSNKKRDSENSTQIVNRI